MSDLLRPCLDCGEVSEQTRCTEHRPPAKSRPSRAAGYDHAWDELSKRARKLQPWCSNCGTTEDLTTDHSEEAWRRKAKGLSIRLRDVDVLCRSCNAAKGSARGDMTPGRSLPEPRRESKFQSLRNRKHPGGVQ